MLYTPLTNRALELCFEAHKNQKDKGGIPYVFHPFHLAEQMETEEEICVALLHDVVEDTEKTLDDIVREGFPRQVTDALALLTHDDGTSYLDYVARLKNNPIAAKVKLADLRHNSTPGRLSGRKTDTTVLSRMQKYLCAQAILTGGDADLENMCLYIVKDGCRVCLSPDGRILL